MYYAEVGDGRKGVYGNVPYVMAEIAHITFKYNGPAVDDGTMALDEVVEALQGFSGAYQKLANRVSPGTTYELKVSGFGTGSFEMLILAAMIWSHYGDQLKALGTVVEGVKWVISLLRDVIQAKKHTKGRPFNISVSGDNNRVLIINQEGSEFSTTREVLEILQDGLVDKELKRIAEPLDEGSVDSAEIVAQDVDVRATISSPEKPYFQLEGSESKINPIEIVGKLVSLNKERDKGTFRLKNNETVPYHFVGNDKEQFYEDFSHEGLVKAVGKAEFDENLRPTRLDIQSAHPIQAELALGPGTDTETGTEE
jgi:hypothetical protein